VCFATEGKALGRANISSNEATEFCKGSLFQNGISAGKICELQKQIEARDTNLIKEDIKVPNIKNGLTPPNSDFRSQASFPESR
jgi:hypothetical protein